MPRRSAFTAATAVVAAGAVAIVAGGGRQAAADDVAPLPPVVAMAGAVHAVEPEGDGVRAAVVDDGRAAAVEHLDGRGVRTALEPLLGEPVTSIESAVLLPRGGAAVGDDEGEAEDAVGVSVVGGLRDGSSLRRQLVSSKRRPGLLASPLASGPTGAAGVVLLQQQGRSGIPVLAFRPAGSSKFRAPIALSTIADFGTSGLVVLGPDGGGVVLCLPDRPFDRPDRFQTTLLRRISPSGRLGPPQRLAIKGPARGHAVVSATGRFLADGTFVAAFAAMNGSRSTTWFTSMRPGARRAARPQRLGTTQEDAAIAVAEPSSGRVAVLAEAGRGSRLFTGSPRRLLPGPALPLGARWTALERLTDGRLIAVGRAPAGFLTLDTGKPGAFPAPLTGFPMAGAERGTASPENPELGDPVALPGGRLATPWTTDDGQLGFLLVSTPAP